MFFSNCLLLRKNYQIDESETLEVELLETIFGPVVLAVHIMQDVDDHLGKYTFVLGVHIKKNVDDYLGKYTLVLTLHIRQDVDDHLGN